MRPILYILFASTMASCGSQRYGAATAYDSSDQTYGTTQQELAALGYFDPNAYSSADKTSRYAEERYSVTDTTRAGDKTARLVIRNARLNIRVKDVSLANDSLQFIAEKYNGYVVSTSTYVSTIRVNAEMLDKAIADIGNLGKLRSKSLTGKDETSNYVDLGIRLDNARKARERYLELLAQAENVTAALLVEKELERLNGEIEFLTNRRENIAHLAQHATISIQFSKQDKLGPLGYVFVGLWKGVSWLFVRG